MSTRFLAIAALVLWLATGSVAAYMFVNGQTTTGVDGRTAIHMSAEERDLVLTEMRTMLTSVQGIITGLSKEDLEMVRASAHKSGNAIAVEVPPTLMAKLPLEFKTMGMGVHRGFDEMSVAVEQKETTDMILSRLGDQLNSCVACHSAYKLEVGSEQVVSR